MRKFFAFLILLLAILAELALVLLPTRFVLDGMGSTETLALVASPLMQASLLLAIIGALIGGVGVSFAAWQRGVWWLGPMLLPLFWPVTLRFGAATWPPLVYVVHAALGLGLGTICGTNCLNRLSPGMLRAALLCGESPFGVVLRVMLPVMAPGVLAGVLLASIGSVLLTLMEIQAPAPHEVAPFFREWPVAFWLPVASAFLISMIAWLLRRR